MLPIVALFRDLSDSKLNAYEAVVERATLLGLEPLKLNIPVRQDVMRVVDQSILRRDEVVVQIAHAIGSEGGREISMLSLGLSDKTEGFAEVVAEISGVLGREPEFPAVGAQFAFLESDVGRVLVSLADVSGWINCPEGRLGHVTVSPFQSGVLISQSVQAAK